MTGIIFMPVPYIIGGTTSQLHGLASYYHPTVHFNPSQSKKSSMHYIVNNSNRSSKPYKPYIYRKKKE